MSKKLIEEIATIFCRNCRCFDVRSAIKGEERCATGFPLSCQFAQDDANKAITLTAQAIVQGKELDEMLGIVGRGNFDDLGPADPVWDCCYIAFRPSQEEGVGHDKE